MKKKIFSVIMAGLLIATITGCGKTEEQAKTEEKPAGETVSTAAMTLEEEEEAWKKEPAYGQPIKIAYNGGLCAGTFGIAQMKGFYQAEGLDTEVVNAQDTREALGTGKVQVSSDHIASWTVPTVNGVNMVFTAGVNTGCQSLYVLADSDVKSTADLIGKTIAIPDGIGYSSHNISLRFLSHDNIDAKDVTFKHVETSGAMVALEKGEIDAITCSDQFAKPFLDEGKLKIIRSITFDEDFAQEACCIHAINGDFYRENPVTSKKLTRAFIEADKWYENNKEEAVQLLLDNDWLSADYEFCLELAKTYHFDIPQEDTKNTLISILDDYKDFDLISKDLDTTETLNKIWVDPFKVN